MKLISSVQKMAPFSPVEMVHLVNLVMVIINHNVRPWKSPILVLSMLSKLLVECDIH